MSGQPSSLRSADAAANVHRVLPSPKLVGDVLELAVAEVMEHQVLAAVGRELEAVVHDLRGREMPQIDVASEIGGDVEIEQAVAIVVDPDRAVAVHPPVQARGLGDVLKVVAIDVLEEREISVAIDEQVLAAVVVEVAPDAAHRDAFAGPIEIGESRACGDVLEGAVAAIAVERVRRAEAAVREVQIGPAVAIEVRDGDRRAQRGDVRLDVRDLRVECRPMMNERDAGGRGPVMQHEAGLRGVGGRSRRPAIEANRRDERGKKNGTAMIARRRPGRERGGGATAQIIARGPGPRRLDATAGGSPSACCTRANTSGAPGRSDRTRRPRTDTREWSGRAAARRSCRTPCSGRSP